MGEDKPALEMTKEEIEKFGPLATTYIGKYLSRDPNVDTSKAAIYKEGKTLKIGSEPIKIEGDNIIIKGYLSKGTPGLWTLLTSKDIPDKTEYNAKDLKDYIFIMNDTNTTRTGFNKDNKRIGGNKKMNELIKPFVIELENGGEYKLINKIEEHFGQATKTDEDEDYEVYEEFTISPTKGTGLKILPSNPNALINRFDLLFSSKKAGHTGVRNEIVSILDELKRQGVLKTNEYKKLNSLIKK